MVAAKARLRKACIAGKAFAALGSDGYQHQTRWTEPAGQKGRDRMDSGTNTAATRAATRLSFLVAGFMMACWAPLIPYAKARSGVDEAGLGLLLLCLGIGSLIAMPLTGFISARTGAKPMILLGGFGLCVLLPVLAVVSAPWALALGVLIFGASLGTIDVAMNVHSVEVEKSSKTPLMSGFHAMFSLGGFAGAGGVTLLLTQGVTPLMSALIAVSLAFVALVLAAPRLLKAAGGTPPAFALPRGIVLLLAGLTAVIFLVEGAVLDWGALLLVERKISAVEQAGMGYMMFNAAMTIGRLTGDRIVAGLGPYKVLIFGSALTFAGFALALTVDWMPGTMAGFVLIGLGAANLVPVLFSATGRQTVMPAGMAIAAVTTTGYAGILAGPALIGLAAHATSLPTAFWMLGFMVLLLPACAHIVVGKAR